MTPPRHFDAPCKNAWENASLRQAIEALRFQAVVHSLLFAFPTAPGQPLDAKAIEILAAWVQAQGRASLTDSGFEWVLKALKEAEAAYRVVEVPP